MVNLPKCTENQASLLSLFLFIIKRQKEQKGNRKGNVGSEANDLRNGGDNVGGPRLEE